MTTDTAFDLIILGGGPAGSRAALRAAGLGLKTALVESGFLGGACLNSGCIPTKYLLGASAGLPLLRKQIRYKTAHGGMHLDFAALQSRKDRYVKGTRKALQKRLEQAGVRIFKGKGVFSGPDAVTVRGSGLEAELSFAKCIVAIGSAPASYPGLKPDGATVHSPAGLLGLRAVPQSLLIVGGGAIGLELGELFHRFGCAIILAEAAPRLLPREDPEVGATLHAHYRRAGWAIHTGRRIQSLSTVNGRSLLRFEDGGELTAAASLLCVGRKPMASAIAPEAAALPLKPGGWLDTDDCLRCTENIYAVGDVNGRLLLANAADDQGRYAVDHAAGVTGAPYPGPLVPSCIYSGMEYMRVGPTADELRAGGEEVFQSRADLAANPVAQSSGYPRGFVKMLWTNEELRSVYGIGLNVAHVLTPASLLVNGRTQKNMPLPLISAYPALDEVLESAMLGQLESIG